MVVNTETEYKKGEPGFAFIASSYRVNKWWVMTGSNRRPTPCKGAALPTELITPPETNDAYFNSRHLSMLCLDETLELWLL